MKKLLSIMLSFAMLLTTTATVSFAVNNGPAEYTPGSFTSPGMIWFVPIDSNGDYIPAVDPSYDGEYTRYYVYSENTTHNDAVNGATYDKASNTLTLNALNGSNMILECNAMGDDFKINVVGSCSLAQISIYSWMYSSAITFTGNGTLNINANKLFDYGIQAGANYTKGTLTFGNSVKVNISGKTGAVQCTYSTSKNASEAFVFNGTSNATTKSQDVYNEKYNYLGGYSIDTSPKPQYIGQIAKRESDPGGIYTMGNSTLGSGEKGYWAQKYVYSASLQTYLEYGDSLYSFPQEYEWDTYNLGENFDFTQTDETLYNTKYVADSRWQYKICTDSSGKKYACGKYWNSELEEQESEVVTFKAIPDVDNAYQFTTVYTGEQADSFIDGLTPTGSYIDNGYVISPLEPDRDWLGYRVSSSTDPDGIYFKTEGWIYDEDGNETDMYFIRKYNYIEQCAAYIEDRNFGDYGTLNVTPGDFATSGYSLVLDSNGKSVGQYNVGEIKNVHGYESTDDSGKKYIVETNYSGGTDTVYNYQVIDGVYICIETKSVDPATLTRVVERTKLEDVKNYYITNKDFTFVGGSDAHTHTYGDWTVTKEATCTTAGTQTRTCSICGKTETKSIAATGHKYQKYPTKATLTKNGAIVEKCSVCGAKKSTTVIYYPKTISLANTSFVYNGKVQKPTVVVKGANGKVIPASNYTVTYSSGCKNVGKYAVKVTFKGNYSGTKTLAYTIIPKGTAISRLTSARRGFVAKWAKNATQTTGYQIQYTTDAKFKSGAKTVTINKNTLVSKGITRLLAGRRYYVRVRTYRTANKVNYFSAWSSARAVVTK